MYERYTIENVRAETDYRAEVARRGLKPSRRRARALEESEHRALTRQR